MTASERKRVLVTGGAKGIGAAIVRALAGAGFDVSFTYRSSGEQAQALAKAIAEEVGLVSVEALPLDLADQAALDGFLTKIAEGGPYYGLVHNAGQPYDMLSMMVDQAKAQAAFQVNFFALMQLVKALSRGMMRARSGRIVAIGSVTATRSNQGNAVYGASKAAVEAYMRTLAIETASRGITANTIAPGFVDTDMMGKYADYRDKMEKQIPSGRFAKPDEIGALAAFLMSPAAAYITGTTIPIDGGLCASMGLQR
jgi:3-oxoacyl-[acyl-carrier protein] reductase